MKPQNETPVQLTAMSDDQTPSDYMAEMDDAQLLKLHRTAYEDCLEAQNTQSGSEWHEACFAAVYLLSCEVTKRGLETRTLH